MEQNYKEVSPRRRRRIIKTIVKTVARTDIASGIYRTVDSRLNIVMRCVETIGCAQIGTRDLVGKCYRIRRVGLRSSGKVLLQGNGRCSGQDGAP